MKKVVVIMPVYNGELTIQRAIDSLLFQTYQNWKCVIVNDGSIDSTKEILDGLNDERFTVHHFEKNMGRPYARQKCLDLAEGDLLAFLDADDFYHPMKLELQVSLFDEDNELSLAFSKIGSFDEKLTLRTSRGYMLKKDDREVNSCEKLELVHASAMLKLSCAKNVKYNLALKQGQDIDFLERYINKFAEIDFIDNILYYYSEFQYNSKIKILKASFYLILKSINNRSFILFMKNIILFVSKLIVLPFVSIDWLTSRRGDNKISDYETNEFKQSVFYLKSV